MNVFNRITIVIICIALAVAALTIIALAWANPDSSISGLRDAVDWLQRHNADKEKVLLSIALGAVAFVGVVIALLELLPDSGTEVKVTDLEGANAVLSTTAIGQRIDEAVRQVAHVVAVKSAVGKKRKGVVVGLDLHVDPDANLAQVTDESCQAAREVLANKIHVGLAEPVKARLHYRELRMRGREVVKPIDPNLSPVMRAASEPRLVEPRMPVEPVTPVEPVQPIETVQAVQPEETVAATAAPVVVQDPPRENPV